MPLFNRRRQLPSDQFSRAEGNAMIPRWTRPPERNTYDWIKMFSKSPRLSVVERIEGFASEEQWKRAYQEINEFEEELERWGAVIIKFWLHFSKEEQLKRFELRQNTPEKQWKITDEDWRNRDKYPQYKAAIEDMFRLTSTPFAPWMVLESDDKRHARVKALKIINDALEARLREK